MKLKRARSPKKKYRAPRTYPGERKNKTPNLLGTERCIHLPVQIENKHASAVLLLIQEVWHVSLSR